MTGSFTLTLHTGLAALGSLLLDMSHDDLAGTLRFITRALGNAFILTFLFVIVEYDRRRGLDLACDDGSITARLGMPASRCLTATSLLVTDRLRGRADSFDQHIGSLGQVGQPAFFTQILEADVSVV